MLSLISFARLILIEVGFHQLLQAATSQYRLIHTSITELSLLVPSPTTNRSGRRSYLLSDIFNHGLMAIFILNCQQEPITTGHGVNLFPTKSIIRTSLKGPLTQKQSNSLSKRTRTMSMYGIPSILSLKITPLGKRLSQGINGNRGFY